MSTNLSGPHLVRSRKRIADHGEVFTPSWLVEEMLELVKHETERIDSRFLEPACGSGNFLVPVLQKKLAAVSIRHRKSEFEDRHYALFALMCTYGIEILQDNAEECRANLLLVYCSYLNVDPSSLWGRAGQAVLDINIIQGDALTMTTTHGAPITFPEWAYLGRGKYQRRDFRYDALTERASFKGTLWEEFEDHQVFVPVRTYPPMSVSDIGR